MSKTESESYWVGALAMTLNIAKWRMEHGQYSAAKVLIDEELERYLASDHCDPELEKDLRNWEPPPLDCFACGGPVTECDCGGEGSEPTTNGHLVAQSERGEITG